MDRTLASRTVKDLARDAGFGLCGIATLAPAATGAAYLRWLDRGDQAGMEWMRRNVGLRLDARGLLAGARSALVVGLRYAPRPDEPGPGGRGILSRVARYARGDDYHVLLRRRLGRLALAIEAALPGCRTRVCVDTAPLLERDLAARAGVGAIGKNTVLLHPEQGSWLVLAEILTTADLAADEPLADLCGDCRRCLDACPTHALPAPYRLDARRCLSYWTIEHRGPIGEEIRQHLNEWLFGCDICQDVCPWNRELEPVSEPGLTPSRAVEELDLAGLLRLDPEEYRERFRGSAMKRAKLEGLRRNAALALAGSAEPRDRAALVAAAGDPSAPVREAAAWALARDGRSAAGRSGGARLTPSPEKT